MSELEWQDLHSKLVIIIMKRVGGLGRFLRAHGSRKNILVVSGRENVECHASGLHVVLLGPPWLLGLG